MACQMSLNITRQQNSDGGQTDMGGGTNVAHILQSGGLIWQICKVGTKMAHM